MRRILISYSIAALLGIGLGLIMGRSKFARAFLTPYFEVIRPIPAGLAIGMGGPPPSRSKPLGRFWRGPASRS